MFLSRIGAMSSDEQGKKPKWNISSFLKQVIELVTGYLLDM
jgi:hypothetical protein